MGNYATIYNQERKIPTYLSKNPCFYHYTQKLLQSNKKPKGKAKTCQKVGLTTSIDLKHILKDFADILYASVTFARI